MDVRREYAPVSSLAARVSLLGEEDAKLVAVEPVAFEPFASRGLREATVGTECAANRPCGSMRMSRTRAFIPLVGFPG